MNAFRLMTVTAGTVLLAATSSQAILVSTSTPVTGEGGDFSDGANDFYGVVTPGPLIAGTTFTPTLFPSVGDLTGRDIDDGGNLPSTRTATWSIAAPAEEFLEEISFGMATLAATEDAWDAGVDMISFELLLNGEISAGLVDYRPDMVAGTNHDLREDTNFDGVGDGAMVSTSGIPLPLLSDAGGPGITSAEVRFTVNAESGNEEFWTFGMLSGNTSGASIEPPPVAWDVDASGSWNSASNWSTGVVPDGGDAVARFLGTILTDRTVSIDNDVTARDLEFDNENSYTIEGPGTLNLKSNEEISLIDIGQGDHVIAAPTSFVVPTLILADSGSLTFVGDMILNEVDVEAIGAAAVEHGVGATLTGSGSVIARYIGRGGSIHATGDLSVGDFESFNGFYSNGEIAANGNTVILLDANDAVLDSAALVDLGFDGTLAAIGGITLDFGGNIIGHGTIDTFDDPATPLINNGHVTGNSPDEPITLTGYVKGVGTCDNCQITGTDAPGFSTAAVSRGSVSYNGTLEIEIGGTIPGSDFDQLNHILGAGVAELAGALEVLLTDGFSPALDDSFEIITATGEVNGTFTTMADELPPLDEGLTWAINYGTNNVVLAIIVAGLIGDYNNDGTVDAIDYAVWRDNLGSDITLPGDTTPGSVTQADYDVWKLNYGNTSGGGASSAAVPEPSSLLTWLALASAAGFRRRH